MHESTLNSASAVVPTVPSTGLHDSSPNPDNGRIYRLLLVRAQMYKRARLTMKLSQAAQSNKANLRLLVRTIPNP